MLLDVPATTVGSDKSDGATSRSAVSAKLPSEIAFLVFWHAYLSGVSARNLSTSLVTHSYKYRLSISVSVSWFDRLTRQAEHDVANRAEKQHCKDILYGLAVADAPSAHFISCCWPILWHLISSQWSLLRFHKNYIQFHFFFPFFFLTGSFDSMLFSGSP